MSTNETITLAITINGETRNVEFTQRVPGRWDSDYVFAGRVGRGAKLHRTHAYAWERNGEIKFQPVATILNRAGCPIICWADQVGQGARSKSTHHHWGNA